MMDFILKDDLTLNSGIYFDYCAVAMASTFASIIELMLFRRGKLSPPISIAWCCIAWGLWLYYAATEWQFCQIDDYTCTANIKETPHPDASFTITGTP